MMAGGGVQQTLNLRAFLKSAPGLIGHLARIHGHEPHRLSMPVRREYRRFAVRRSYRLAFRSGLPTGDLTWRLLDLQWMLETGETDVMIGSIDSQ